MDFLQSKKILWVFAAIGAVAILTAVAARFFVFSAKRQAPAVKNSEFSVEKKDIDQSRLPDKFPSDMPLETGARVTSNYTAVSNAGKFQATREFETKQTLEENAKIYADYLTKNQWQLQTGVDQENTKVIIAIKGSLEAQITITNNPAKHVKTVQITIVEIN